MLKEQKIALLGGGHMAQAIVRGLIEKQAVAPTAITVIDPVSPEKAAAVCQAIGVNHGEPRAAAEADIVILAFKPQNFSEAAQMYAPYLQPPKLIISILAGVGTAVLAAELPAGLRIIRTMPNLALSVGLSTTAFCRGANAGDAEAALATELFANLGIVREVAEEQIATVTALSGSGPAYIYYLIEAMIEAAVEQGMDADVAIAFAKQTLLGAAKLLDASGEEPATMRKQVTSKKGTTEAAILTMTENNFYEAVKRGMAAAHRRTLELGNIKNS